MKMNDIENNVMRIVSQIYNSKEEMNEVVIKKNTMFISECGFTSMEIVDLVFDLEKMFEISFKGSDLDLENFKNVETVVKCIEKNLNG